MTVNYMIIQLLRVSSGALLHSNFAEHLFCRLSLTGKTPFVAAINVNSSPVFFREPHRDVMFRCTETGIKSAKI